MRKLWSDIPHQCNANAGIVIGSRVTRSLQCMASRIFGVMTVTNKQIYTHTHAHTRLTGERATSPGLSFACTFPSGQIFILAGNKVDSLGNILPLIGERVIQRERGTIHWEKYHSPGMSSTGDFLQWRASGTLASHLCLTNFDES